MEILVVIAILGVISYGVSMKVQASVQSTQAKAIADQTAAACEKFHSEYGYYPPKNGSVANSSEDIFFSLESKSFMFLSSLTGEDSIHNSKSKSFLSIPQAKNNLRNGLYLNELGVPSGLLDPWGKGYAVMLDYNYDGKIHLVRYGEDLRLPVAVFRAGPDGEWATDDDVKSWK